MRGYFLTVLFGVICFASRATPVLAHHSLAAEFDLSKRIVVTGTVTKVEWTNPHVWFYLDVRDAASRNTVRWAFQLSGLNALAKLGWTRSSLKTGDVVTVYGAQSKGNWRSGSAREIRLSDGQKIFRYVFRLQWSKVRFEPGWVNKPSWMTKEFRNSSEWGLLKTGL
jgi:hypothetical protein